MTGDVPEVLRRRFVALATSDYDDPTCRPLPGVTGEVKTLRDWLCDPSLGERTFTVQCPELASNPTKQQVRDALEVPAQLWNDSDAAVVFVTGHGVTGHGRHWIVLKSTSTGQLFRTALGTADLVGWIADTGIEHLLVILDLCHAGAAADDTGKFADFPATWLALASVTRVQEAKTGALTSAIAGFLAELTSPSGEQFDHGPYLRVDQFLDAVQSRLGDQRLANLNPALPALGPNLCLPNPRHRPAPPIVGDSRRDLALRREDLEAHWDPKSRGVAAGSEHGWLFSGRAALMRHLIQRLGGDVRSVVVTGAAGTGKSAVLGRLVTLSDPTFCERYADLVAGIPEELRPPRGSIDVAVLATGKLPHEVLGQIVEAVHAAPASPSASVPTLAQLRSTWWSWLRRQDSTVTVVVDALDEAKNPQTLLDEVLVQLNPPELTQRRVRLIVGVRSPGGTDTRSEKAPRSGGRSLADATGVALDAERLHVDEPPWWQERDLADYATELLTGTLGSPYRGSQHRHHAQAVSRVLAARAGKSFLVTQLAATNLAHRQDRVDPGDPAWHRVLDDGVLGVFRADLHATLRHHEQRVSAVHLLRAVAFAYGRGLPWRQVWPLVANAVADQPGTYGDNDIVELLTSRLGGYLVTDREDGITVYRLFHDALRSTLRERWRDLLFDVEDR